MTGDNIISLHDFIKNCPDSAVLEKVSTQLARLSVAARALSARDDMTDTEKWNAFFAELEDSIFTIKDENESETL